MSAGQFTPNPQKRRWNGQRRSQITDADLANYGLPAGQQMSLDRSRQIATGLPPGAKRMTMTPTFPAPAPKAPAAPVQTTGRADLWKQVQRIRAKGATKTTSVTAAPGGVVLNVATRTGQGVAEALVYIPGATLADFT